LIGERRRVESRRWWMGKKRGIEIFLLFLLRRDFQIWQ